MWGLRSATPNRGIAVRDALLVALTFASGAVDAISFFGLGRIFSAFMTGNLVFLGFGVGDGGGPALVPVVCALVGFSAGAYVGTWIAPTPSTEQGLWPRRVSVALGVAVLFEAAFLAAWIASDGQPADGTINWLLGFSSLAMGLQTAAVRALLVPGVFTTAATFTVLALAGDFAGSRPKAEAPRLAAVLIGLVAGAAAGGFLFINAVVWAPLLPLLVTGLAIACGEVLRRGSGADAGTPHA